MLCTRKFSRGKFFGASTHGILRHSRFRKYSRFWWPSLRFKVRAAQSEVIGKNWSGYEKSRGAQNQKHFFIFRPRSLILNKPGLQVYESRLIQFPTSRTKIGGVSLILDTAIALRQILKRGSTSAALLKHPLPPLAIHILNPLDMRIHQVSPMYSSQGVILDGF